MSSGKTRAPSVRIVKDAYVIINGLALDHEEKASLCEPVPLLEFEGLYSTTWESDSFHCSQAKIAVAAGWL